MRRHDYTSGGKSQRPKDPTIKTGQIWRSISQHDFGRGPMDYSIRINFQDPIKKTWNCSYIYDQGTGTITYSGATPYVVQLTQEEIEKNFEFQAAPTIISPNVNPQQPNQWAPMQPQYPLPNAPIWIAPVNNGMHYVNDIHTYGGGAGVGTYGSSAGTYSQAIGNSNQANQSMGYNSNFDAVSGAQLFTPTSQAA